MDLGWIGLDRQVLNDGRAKPQLNLAAGSWSASRLVITQSSTEHCWWQPTAHWKQPLHLLLRTSILDPNVPNMFNNHSKIHWNMHPNYTVRWNLWSERRSSKGSMAGYWWGDLRKWRVRVVAPSPTPPTLQSHLLDNCLSTKFVCDMLFRFLTSPANRCSDVESIWWPTICVWIILYEEKPHLPIHCKSSRWNLLYSYVKRKMDRKICKV